MSQYLFILSVSLCCGVAKADTDWGKANREVKDHLVNLVNINTSQPAGNEVEAARYIYRILNREGIDWSIYQFAPGRANIVAYLKGQQNGEKPLLLVSHLDTVGVDRREWTVEPFKATEKNGRIYGRGTTDCKDLTAINLEIMVMLKRSGVKLKRDVIMLALADEEAGSHAGLRWLMENKWQAIEAGFALNEGGGLALDSDGKARSVFVEAAEKMYLDLKLAARGASGHSAVAAPADNAIYKLARALAAVENYKPAARLTPMTRKFFRDIYPIQDTDARTTIDMLLSDDAAVAAQAAKAVAANPFFNSQMRDTITPTILEGGYSPNVVPSEASALLNCRLLPDTDPEKFIADIKNAVKDDKVSVIVLEEPRIPFPPPMRMDDELFKAISSASADLFPGAAVVGGMVSGNTDSEFLRRKGVIAYGLGGRVNYGDGSGMHGADEHISQDELFMQFKLIYEVARRFSVRE